MKLFPSLQVLDHIKTFSTFSGSWFFFCHFNVSKCHWSLTACLSPVSLPATKKGPWSLPQGLLLNQACNWPRPSAVEKNCIDWYRYSLTYEATGNWRPTSKSASYSMCYVIGLHCSAPLYGISQRQFSLCVLMSCVSFDFVLAEDCSACSAVIWTPFCCWRANTTSAPRCCRVRGRTSPSQTTVTGRNWWTNPYQFFCVCVWVISFHCCDAYLQKLALLPIL